ncbi:MAG TPA: V-type ATPase 116kDa subunit family protein, partial [Candidatus Latescibacteria bacterium]|nr:V-type ATPase 116kDa subunit family protein [Candidatus Latescibacterota bacterium]
MNPARKEWRKFFRRRNRYGAIWQQLRRNEERRSVNWTLEELRSTQQLAVHIGVLSEVNVRRVEAILGALPHTTVRLPGPATGWDVVIVFSQKATADQVERALSSANFKPLEIPEDLTGKPGEAEEKLWKLLEELEEQRKTLTQQLRETTTAEMGELCEIWEKARAARTLLAAQQPFGKTRALSYVTGWVPKESSQALTQRIRDTIGAAAYVEVRDPDPHDPAVPVRLKNPSVFRPFEEVVTTYSLPSSKEIDPTVVVAITYLIMFGMMFGDVGQGLVLAGAGFWAAKKAPSVKNLGLILGMCGISSVIFGFIYGSVFGVEMQLNPWINLPLVEHHTSVMASNLAVLGGISIGFGIIMLSLGIVFNIVNAVRAKEWGIAVFDQYGLTGLAFYWCALIWAVFTALGYAGVGMTALAAAALVALVVLFVREPIIRATERKEHLVEGGVGFFVVQALIDTMDMVIRFLSNTVSFIRVA